MKQAPAKIRRRSKRAPQETRMVRPAAAPSRFVFTELHWQIACAVLIVGAALVRILFLTVKPIHHDEGVNGFFMTSLFRDGNYHYDPANYHGPDLYYFALTTTTLWSFIFGKDGLSIFPERLIPVLFGVGVVWLVLKLRRHLGVVGTLGAALLCTVSSAFLFYSRYFIHEISLIFFTLGILVAALRFYETRKTSYFLWCAAAAAMVFATKETSVIIFALLPASLAAAWGYSWLYDWLPKWFRSFSGRKEYTTMPLWRQASVPAALLVLVVLALFRNPLKSFLQQQKTAMLAKVAAWTAQPWFTHNQLVITFMVLLAVLTALLFVENQWSSQWKPWQRYCLLVPSGLLLFACIAIPFYSSFFNNPQGVQDSINTYTKWTKTANTDDVHSTWTYVKWGTEEELIPIIFGLMGIITALVRGRDRFGLFVSFWAAGMFVAYSQIPYKTPWLILNILLPMILAAGYLFQRVYDLYRSLRWQIGFAAMWIAGIALTLWAAGANKMPGMPDMAYSCDQTVWCTPYIKGSGLLDSVWIALCIIVPLVIIFGYATLLIFGMRWERGWRRFCGLIAASAICFMAYQSIDLSYVHDHQDDNDNPYIYAHTVHDFDNLIKEIETVGVLNGMWDNDKREWKTSIMIAAPEYWPMPWLFRDYPNAGYWGRLDPNSKPDQQLVIVRKEDQGDQAKQLLEPTYHAFNEYEMRPGNTMVLYVKNGVRLSAVGGPGSR